MRRQSMKLIKAAMKNFAELFNPKKLKYETANFSRYRNRFQR
jgi:hypothetical protein